VILTSAPSTKGVGTGSHGAGYSYYVEAQIGSGPSGKGGAEMGTTLTGVGIPFWLPQVLDWLLGRTLGTAPNAKEMALPWRTVVKIYWQFYRERTTRKTIRRNKEKSSSRTLL
jgi:hypothetical protein